MNEMDMFWSGEGSGDVTAVKLAAQKYGTDAGTWSFPDGDPDADITFSATGQLATLRYPITVDGVTYDGAGSSGFDVNFATDDVSEFRYALATERDEVLVGFFLKMNPESNWANLDVLRIDSAAGTAWSVVLWISSGTPVMRAHSELGYGSDITVANNELYWVQCKYHRNVAATVAVWKVSDWSFVGSSTLGLADQAAANIAVGINAHATTSPTSPNIYSDNYVFKFTGTIGDADDFMLSQPATPSGAWMWWNWWRMRRR